MPEAIDMIQRALKAGHPFGQCLKLVAEDMEEPIAREFELTFADLSFGNDPRRALFGLLQRVPSVSVTALITAVLVQRETGGNLAENLGTHQQRDSRPVPFPAPREDAVGRRPDVRLDPRDDAARAVREHCGCCIPSTWPELDDHPRGPTLISHAVGMGTIGILWIRRLVRIEV